MRRRLLINYADIEREVFALMDYQKECVNLKNTINQIDQILGEAKGLSIIKLHEVKTKIISEITMIEEQIKDLHAHLSAYSSEQVALITPIDFGSMVVVNCNDIWYRLQKMSHAIKSFQFTSINQVNTYAYQSATHVSTDIKSESNLKGQRNKAKLDNLYQLVNQTRNSLWTNYDQMNKIYINHVVAFEQKDVEYKGKLVGHLRPKHFGVIETALMEAQHINSEIADGIVEFGVESGKGIIDFSVGTFKYLGGALPFINGEFKDHFNNVNNAINYALSNPTRTFKLFVKNSLQQIEEDGLIKSGGKLVAFSGIFLTGVEVAKQLSFDRLLNLKGKFVDEVIEARYQRYLARKLKQGKPARSRLEWKNIVDDMVNLRRGNEFNKTVQDMEKYDFHEIHLENGKRLDSYSLKKGEIISRKATDLDKITEKTYRSYLNELVTKYKRGTVIKSQKYKRDLYNKKLSGKYYLEIPDTNKNLKNIEHFRKIAKEYDVELRFTKEK